MKRIALLIALLSVAIAAINSVRIGAITLAAALAIYSFPMVRNQRKMDLIVPILLIVSLITVALALPRR